MRRACALGGTLIALAGCGGGGRSDHDVIQAWTTAERHGRYADANKLFAVPSTIENGTRIHVTLRAEIDVFNRSLPCGAVLTKTAPAGGGQIEATFRLVAGPGGPCSGTAHVRFRIKGGKITEWIREDSGAPAGSTEI